jgi:hypothetical protein
MVLAPILGLLCTQAWADYGANMYIHTINIANMPADRIFLRGEEVEIYFKVHNAGTEAASRYAVYCGLYQNLVLKPHKHALGSTPRGSLAPDQLDEFTWTITLPDECPRGTYYIAAKIECPEDDYSMDRAWSAGEFKILEPWPDLTPTTLNGVSGIYLPGGDIMLSVSVKNNGGVRADGYTVDFYAGEYSIGHVERGIIERLATDTFQTKCVFPYDMPEGDYTVRVKVSCPADPSPADDERSGLAINIRFFSDLTFLSLDVTDGTYSPGGQIMVHAAIQNAGQRASDKYVVDYYMSSDRIITTRDYHVGSANRDGLAVGGQDSFEVNCQLPVYVPQGDWYIGAMITCVNDGNGGNNDRTVDKPVKLVYPPLYVSGRVEYRDLDSRPRPVRCALVRICDVGNADDPLDDRVIAETSTGVDGGYGVLVPADE